MKCSTFRPTLEIDQQTLLTGLPLYWATKIRRVRSRNSESGPWHGGGGKEETWKRTILGWDTVGGLCKLPVFTPVLASANNHKSCRRLLFFFSKNKIGASVNKCSKLPCIRTEYLAIKPRLSYWSADELYCAVRIFDVWTSGPSYYLRTPP